MSELLTKYAETYRKSLLTDVIPFWEKHSPDLEYGGYFTCLDRQGNVFDTEKYIWLQARQMWMFSKLYNEVEKKTQWLDLAKLGADFLIRFGRDQGGNFYYALDRAGNPIMQPFSIFSDGFVVMAFSQYAKATGNDQAREIAEATYKNYLKRKNNPKGQFDKSIPSKKRNFPLAIRMIHMNMLLEMAWQMNSDKAAEHANMVMDEVMGLFLHLDKNILYENVLEDGSHPDTPAGRTINPGHGIEVLWMVLSGAVQWHRDDLIPKIVDAILSTFEYGWDGEYGGLIYRLDVMNKPIYQIEWDQKMWWAQAEALIALTLSYFLTHREECVRDLILLHEYIWNHYVDNEYGEWFGYLNRYGRRLMDIKGGRWKGCFHVPRALLYSWNNLTNRSFKQKETKTL